MYLLIFSYRKIVLYTVMIFVLWHAGNCWHIIISGPRYSIPRE